MIVVSRLFIYPIKSCRAIGVAAAEVVARGFLHDRRWMLVDERGSFLTQRDLPRLTLVRTNVVQDEIHVLSQGLPELRLPASFRSGPARAVEVWGYEGSALEHADGSAWFSELFGRKVSLVYMPDTECRPVSPRRAKPGDIVSFADGYPFLLASEASLAELNRRLDFPVTMERFRPNIVVDGCVPFDEDSWSKLTIGDVRFRVVKPCDRCVVTTIDPVSADRGKEPLFTLAQFRKIDGKVLFGMNLVHESRGTLRVGDSVSLA